MTSMVKQAGLNLEFWVEALPTTIHLINLSPSKAIKLQVPPTLLSGNQPTYNQLRIFGCEAEAYSHLPHEKRTKLAPHSRKCIFLGYGTNETFKYRLWDPENRKLIQSNDVIFNEESINLG